MISGSLALLLVLALAPANPPDAAQLVAHLARPVPAHTAYAEVRYLHQLTRPMLLRGELSFAGPGKLGKRVDSPYREDTRIDAGSVEVQRAGRATRHFELSRAPQLQVLLQGFSALLDGDAAALAQDFQVDIAGSSAHWTLTLRPRDAALARHLQALVVTGAGAEPACFILEQANGDASVMLLGARAAQPLDPPPARAALRASCSTAP